MIPDLSTRSRESELMDDPDCDSRLLLRTVAQFEPMNRLLSRFRSLLERYVISEMRADPARRYRLADLGAGGCDIAAWLLERCEAEGLQLEIIAYELDPRIVEFARERYGHLEGLSIVEQSVLEAGPDVEVDFLFANHFIHHLEDDQIVDLLRLWMPSVRSTAVFSDLLRGHSTYLGYTLFAGPTLRDSFAYEDGLTSIRKAFRPRELGALALRSGVPHEARVRALFPCRLALVLQAPDRD